MRAFVFTDRALERQAGRFVWLSIDAEKERNAPFLERYPIQAYPTLLVIDPASERAALRWIGGATLRQLEGILVDGERAWRGEGNGPDALLVRADRLLGEGRADDAVRAYRKAIDRSGPDWHGRDRAVEALLTVLGTSGRVEECVRTAGEEMPDERTPHYANVAAAGLGCALEMEGPGSPAAVSRFEAMVLSTFADPAPELPVDDRSGLYGLLLGAREAQEDEEGAKRVAGQWIAFLEQEAARAPNAAARAVFDAHRLSAAIELGDPMRAVPALEQSARDFPEDFNPPARLAVAYREVGRYDEALAAADRALALAYGPRKLRIFSTRADVLEKKGDLAGARATIESALAFAQSLPKSQINPRSVESLRKRMEALGAK
jgi:predicted negative regulator of RcsB-dependent stress response